MRQWTTSVLTSQAEFAACGPEWNELLGASDAHTIFLTWEWISAWITAVHPQVKLFIVVVRDESNRLMAAAPFYRSDFKALGVFQYDVLRILGDCHSGAEYADVIIRRGFEDVALKLIMKELMKHRRVWDCLFITNIAGWTGAGARLGSISRELGLYVRECKREFSAIELADSHEAYLKSLSPNQRQHIRRITRRFDELHHAELVRCDSIDEVPHFLAGLFSLHGDRWESAGQSGCFVIRPALQRFYEVFAPTALEKGWLRLYALKVDGVIKAVQYGYVFDGVFLQLQEGFDPNAFEGIGNILRNKVIQACIDEGVRGYDFLGGFTEHKRRWGGQPREGCDLFIGRRHPRNTLLFGAKLWPMGRFIKEGVPVHS